MKSAGSVARAMRIGSRPAIQTATVARTARRRKSSRSSPFGASRTKKTAAICAHSVTANRPDTIANGDVHAKRPVAIAPAASPRKNGASSEDAPNTAVHVRASSGASDA